MRQVQIKNGMIVNEWVGELPAPVPPSNEWTFIDVTDIPEAVVGGRYVDGQFLPPPPQRKTVISKLDFYQRFTPEERITFRQGAKTDPVLADLEMMLQMAETVNLESAATQQGIQYMVSANVLTPERAVEVLHVEEFV